MRYPRIRYLPAIILCLPLMAACQSEKDQYGTPDRSVSFELVGYVDNPILDEISGIETASNSRFFVHNDEGKPLLHVISDQGFYQAAIEMNGAKNRDWEDLTAVPYQGKRWLVAGDIGDNQARYKTIRLYFMQEPAVDEQGNYPASQPLEHRIKLKYPDGPRDCEAMAYDASSEHILFMTKRDRIPRLYGVPIETAFSQESAELSYLGEVPTFTPPTELEKLRSGKKALWLSQPTGMDISDDGTLATVITYRSLYLFMRENNETWIEAFQKKPQEFVGPPGVYDEAVTIDEAKTTIYVTTEKVPTPLFKLSIP